MLKLMKYLRPFSISLTVVIILVFLQSLSELFLPTLMSEIVDVGIVQGDIPFILKMGALMLFVAGIGTGCSILANYLSAKAATGLGKILRQQVFAKVESFSLQEMDRFGTATLITRTTNDITQVQQVLVMVLRMMISAPMMCIGGIIMAVSKDPVLSQIFLAVLPLLVLAIILIASRGIPLFKAMQVKLDRLNLVLRESLIGIRVIRAFHRVDHEKARYKEANFDLTDTTLRVNRIMAALMPTMMLVMNLTTISIIWFGGLRIDQGNMQVGDMMAFIQYAMQIMFAFIMVSMMFVMIPRAAVSAVRINEVLTTQPEIIDTIAEQTNILCDDNKPKGLSERTPEIKSGTVEFLDVSFKYPGAERYALNNISFQAKPGKMTAIIGGTGSGKSTLVKLLLRFYETTEGKIRVNSQDIQTIPLAHLRQNIGYVPQKAILFTGTISENIRYGKKKATDSEMESAAETAQAAEFINKIDEGYAYQISQGGLNLSGGQKQRLAIARTLVKKPEIYIFDDSFSALDFKTDARLRQALKKAAEEANVIIVAQRISTIMNADQIIVLNEGRVAGIGKHKDLLADCGVYQEIVASQLSKEELA